MDEYAMHCEMLRVEYHEYLALGGYLCFERWLDKRYEEMAFHLEDLPY